MIDEFGVLNWQFPKFNINCSPFRIWLSREILHIIIEERGISHCEISWIHIYCTSPFRKTVFKCGVDKIKIRITGIYCSTIIWRVSVDYPKVSYCDIFSSYIKCSGPVFSIYRMPISIYYNIISSNHDCLACIPVFIQFYNSSINWGIIKDIIIIVIYKDIVTAIDCLIDLNIGIVGEVRVIEIYIGIVDCST